MSQTPQVQPAATQERPNLKPCPDCGWSVSARAIACPKCGCPIAPPRKFKDWSLRLRWICLLGGLGLMFVQGIITPANNGDGPYNRRGLGLFGTVGLGMLLLWVALGVQKVVAKQYARTHQ